MADISHGIVSSLKEEIKIDSYYLFKKKILNLLFRYFCFVSPQEKITGITKKDLIKLVGCTTLSTKVVFSVIKDFITNARYLKLFLAMKPINWEYDRIRLAKKVRIYLHKLYRIAPVFSYTRAKQNLEILHQLLEKKNYWPHITTQIALVIFITDRNDKMNIERRFIIQKNLRAFCDCSAYAFHRARNILRINTNGKVY
jgi:hypothetical protein